MSEKIVQLQEILKLETLDAISDYLKIHRLLALSRSVSCPLKTRAIMEQIYLPPASHFILCSNYQYLQSR